MLTRKKEIMNTILAKALIFAVGIILLISLVKGFSLMLPHLYSVYSALALLALFTALEFTIGFCLELNFLDWDFPLNLIETKTDKIRDGASYFVMTIFNQMASIPRQDKAKKKQAVRQLLQTLRSSKPYLLRLTQSKTAQSKIMNSLNALIKYYVNPNANVQHVPDVSMEFDKAVEAPLNSYYDF